MCRVPEQLMMQTVFQWGRFCPSALLYTSMSANKNWNRIILRFYWQRTCADITWDGEAKACSCNNFKVLVEVLKWIELIRFSFVLICTWKHSTALSLSLFISLSHTQTHIYKHTYARICICARGPLLPWRAQIGCNLHIVRPWLMAVN